MMGALYDVNVRTVNDHLKKVFSDSELEADSVIRKFRITAADGKNYSTLHYSLPAIIAVGYKVNSERAVQFRKWATRIIEAPTSTKNKAGKRGPEMHQTKKGNQWHFGMKAHIGVDARTGITHSFTTIAANEHDLNQSHELLHGEEDFVFADAGYRGAQKRSELQGGHAEWHIAEKPSKLKALKSHPRINKTLLNIEFMKASIRAKVEHPFRIIKCQFGFRKTNYRGLRKNHHKLAMLFTLANIVRVDQMFRA
jgi:IS5 family transposase